MIKYNRNSIQMQSFLESSSLVLYSGSTPLPLVVSPWFIVDDSLSQENESQDYTWHAVASWTWDAQDETCGICRMAFDGCCPDCKLPGDDCPLIWGACNHAFHLHCILKWVNSQTPQAHCPMCRREWQFKG
ncbi:anaphase-promoting complex subunit 11 [Primulina tabacum]|uniref:anaphase-promoting complex subunit 11 n=1 Tax=Primulina tabacum TaxID=48773 RepID=UPI003F5A3BB9